MSIRLYIEPHSFMTEPRILENPPEQAEWYVLVWRKMSSGSRTMDAYRVFPEDGLVDSVDALIKEIAGTLQLGEEDLIELLVESRASDDAAGTSRFIHIAGAQLEDANDGPALD